MDDKCNKLLNELDEFIADDFNTAKVLANIFELVPVINSIRDGQVSSSMISQKTMQQMKTGLKLYLVDIFGLQEEKSFANDKLDEVLQLLIEIRRDARSKKDFMTSDRIRNQLLAMGIQLKDEKDGRISWSFSS
jgi:cysteinyl-tRNA synthetase